MRKSLLVCAALCAAPSCAGAVGFMTKLSCANDYYSYCSQHEVGSAGLRQCMRANGPRLSKSCIDALIADGEVSRAEVEREKAKLLAAKTKPKLKAAEPKPVDVAAIKKPAAPAKLAEAAAKKPATPPQKAKVAAAMPAQPKPDVSKPKITPKIVEATAAKSIAMVPPVARNEAMLDQQTFEALKSRGTSFLALDETVIVKASTRPSEPAPKSDMERASVSTAASAPVEAPPQRQAPAEFAEAEPQPRPVPFPEARMSLGRNISEPQTKSWWDELVDAVTGQ